MKANGERGGEGRAARALAWTGALTAALYLATFLFYVRGFQRYTRTQREVFIWLAVLPLLYLFWRGYRIVRDSGGRVKTSQVVWFAALFCVTCAAVYPFHSTDVFGYINRGWQQVHYHMNPYVHTVAEVPGWRDRPDDLGSLDLQPEPLRLPLHAARARPDAPRRRQLGADARALQGRERRRLRPHGLARLVGRETSGARAADARALLFPLEPARPAPPHRERAQRHPHRVRARARRLPRRDGARRVGAAGARGGGDAQVRARAARPGGARLRLQRRGWKTTVLGCLLAALVVAAAAAPFLADWRQFRLEDIRDNATLIDNSLHSFVIHVYTNLARLFGPLMQFKEAFNSGIKIALRGGFALFLVFVHLRFLRRGSAGRLLELWALVMLCCCAWSARSSTRGTWECCCRRRSSCRSATGCAA